MSTEYYKKVFAKNLNYYMNLKRISQTDIINDLGYDKSAVSTWCNGSRLPRMDKVDAIAQYLGVRRSDLIDEHDFNAPLFNLSPIEKEIILAYRKASPDMQAGLCAFLGIKGDTGLLRDRSIGE